MKKIKREIKELEQFIGKETLRKFDKAARDTGKDFDTRLENTITYLKTLSYEKYSAIMELIHKRAELRKNLIKPEQLTFDEQLEKSEARKAIIIPSTQATFLNEIIPYRIRKGEFKLIDDTITATGRVQKFERKEGDKITRYTFVSGEEESMAGIPKYGLLARQAYFLPHAIALATKDMRPKFRPRDVLRFRDFYTADELKTKVGKVYSDLKNIYKTFAYGTYEIRDRRTDEVIKIGHIFDSVEFDPHKKTIQVILTQETQDLYTNYWSGKKGIKFVKYLTANMGNRHIDKYGTNLDNWLAYIRTLGTSSYPISVKTLLLKKIGYPQSKFKGRGAFWLYTFAATKLIEAKKRGTLKEWENDQKENLRLYQMNYIKYRLRLIV